MKVLLLCLNAFEMMEASPFIDIFGWARDDFGCDIHIVTCGYQKTVKSTFGFQEYGFYEEAYDEKVLQLIRAFHEQEKAIATVCVAAFPLAKSGILKGKRATTYHLRGGYKRDELEKMGVTLGNEWFERDGNIITSSCPRTAPAVAFELLKILTTEEKMNQVKTAMGYM